MQIEEAIGDLKYYIGEDPYFNGTYTPVTDFEKFCYNHCKAIDTVITYVETMQKEFDRLEGIEDNTAMLKCELEKKDAEIAYWKEQTEGYSGLAKSIKEDYENRIYEIEQESK